MRKCLVALLLSSILLVSFGCYAAPPVKYLTEVSRDVGWPAVDITALVMQDFAFYAITEKVPTAPIKDRYDRVEALMPLLINYTKKKFVSHNKRLNNHRKQLYGKLKTDRLINIDTEDPVPIDYVTAVWQWISSNVKDQA